MSQRGWFRSGFTTAVGVAVEYVGPGQGTGGQSKSKLLGYSVQVVSSLAASTLFVELHAADSSAGTASTNPILADAHVANVLAHDLRGLTGGYFSIDSPSTHAGGVLATMWGED